MTQTRSASLVVVLVGNAVLALFLVWEAWQLSRQAAAIRKAIESPILSSNQQEFIDKLRAQMPDAWMWALVVGGLILTLALTLLLTLSPEPRQNLMLRLGTYWLIAWAFMIVAWIISFVYIVAGFGSVLG